MRSGWSIYEYAGGWREDKCTEAIITDKEIMLDFSDPEGDRYVVKAKSQDGTQYHGEYKYPSQPGQNGHVHFTRYKSKAGDVFSGRWEEEGSSSSRGKWIISVDN